MTVLSFDDVWFGYGEEPVLRGVSFRIDAGESVALLGRNGVGKTTVTRLIMALEHPGRGKVSVKGVETAGLGPEDVAAHAAYVFQHPDQQLFARTVGSEVAFGPRQLGRSDADVESLVRESLRALGLEEKRDAHPYDLPPAERKLVTLAAALAQDPAVLVLDEPTQGMDRAQRDGVIEVLRAVAGRGVAVLAVTHDVALVAEALDRSLALADGAVAYDGPTAGLLGNGPLTVELGLEQPVTLRLAEALGLPGVPCRVQEAAAALMRHMGPRI
jgi:energy-coupling factor transport system ATP-binding protein